MSTLSATVNNVSYPVHIPSGYTLVAVLEMRDVLTFTIIDSPGTAVFTRGMPVTFSDSVTGKQYDGYVQSDDPKKLSPNPTSTILLHTLTCMDHQYDVDKIANENPYSGGWHAGDIATDMAVNNKLAAEGILIAAALRHETSTADFNTGTLSNTVGSVAIPSNDGDLELAKAGTDLTITEKTTADFSAGTLTNVTASSNVLSPTTQSAILFKSSLPYAVGDAYIYVAIWSGSMTVGTLDTLHYDIWLPSTANKSLPGVDLIFSDGTRLKDTTGVIDQNGLSVALTTDITAYATNAWYARDLALTSALNGKTINTVLLGFESDVVGDYSAYFKNIYLLSQSGSPFFSTTATATNVSPPTTQFSFGYAPASVSATVAQAFDPANNSRISTAHSIDAVKLLKLSLISWAGGTPGSSSTTISVSYDNGTTYQPCTNNAALPALPVGSVLTGDQLVLKEVFGTTGSDPTQVPNLTNVTVTLQSAPNATKSDVVTTFATQAAWNTGTYSSTTGTAGGDLTLSTFTRDWNNNLITSQTFFSTAGVTQAASSGAYRITVPVDTSINEYGVSRLDFASNPQNFTVEFDVTIPHTYNDSSLLSVPYRTTYWPTSPDPLTGGYILQVQNSGGSIGARVLRGSNSSSSSGTTLVSNTGILNPTHVKIVVTGNHHQIYFNGSGSTTFDFVDSTYSGGQIGLGGWTFFQNPGGSPSSGTFVFDNLVVTPAASGTWTGPSTSISSLGTCGASVISWTEVISSPLLSPITVKSSVDGGSTYQVCTNGGSIPNIPAGTNVSGKSVQLLISINTTGLPTTINPIVRQLVWRVLGQYPTVTGTRTTAPLGIDNMTRANAGSWGTAQDGQTWAKTGTGTVAISSNQATISNTTGDVYEQIGSKTGKDMEITMRTSLSASTIQDGPILRFVDTNNYYKLDLSTTSLSIVKKANGTVTTLASTAVTASTNTEYYLRFRVVSLFPVVLSGKVWLGDGTLVEPGVSAGVMSTSNPQWTVTANDY